MVLLFYFGVDDKNVIFSGNVRLGGANYNSENQFSVVCEKSKHGVKDLRFNGLKVLMTLISGLRADIFATQG